MDILSLFRFLSLNIRPGLPEDYSIADRLDAAMKWLCTAQDSLADGGVALRYSLLKGWQASYPETTGYIIPTFLEYAALSSDDSYRERALQMADWEVEIQNQDGSYNGGPIDSSYNGFVFDTGQIIFGLLAAYKESGNNKYIESANKAGNWLIDVQDARGPWKRFAFNNIPHAYYSRVAWSIAEIGLETGRKDFISCAQKNVDWAISMQNSVGWFDSAGFTTSGHLAPYTHTIAYTIRGILETGICLNRDDYIETAKKSAIALKNILHSKGFFYSTYDSKWESRVKCSCLTGNAQIALIFMRLDEYYGSRTFFGSAQKVNRFLSCTQQLSGARSIRGAISGSFPIWGNYQRFAFPNWATKFFADSLIAESRLSGEERSG